MVRESVAFDLGTYARALYRREEDATRLTFKRMWAASKEHGSAAVHHFMGGIANMNTRTHRRALCGVRGHAILDDWFKAARRMDKEFPRSLTQVLPSSRRMNTDKGGVGGGDEAVRGLAVLALLRRGHGRRDVQYQEAPEAGRTIEVVLRGVGTTRGQDHADVHRHRHHDVRGHAHVVPGVLERREGERELPHPRLRDDLSSHRWTIRSLPRGQEGEHPVQVPPSARSNLRYPQNLPLLPLRTYPFPTLLEESAVRVCVHTGKRKGFIYF